MNVSNRKITVGPRICGDCGKDSPFMVTMMPGYDGVVWFLCLRDFVDGCKPQKIGTKLFEVTEVTPELAEASKKAFGDHYPVKEKRE